jgi:hypothetical protein
MRGRSRTALITAVAGALVAGALGTTPALGAPAPTASSAKDPRAELLRSFAVTSATAPAAGTLRSNPATPARATSKQPVVPAESGRATAAPRRAAAAASPECDALAPFIVQSLDRNHVIWNPLAGATGYSVQRERFGSTARRTIASGLGASADNALDATHNPTGSAAWWVTATVGGSTVSCRTPEDPTQYWSMTTLDGEGSPDVLFAGTSAVYEQESHVPAFKAWNGTMARPAFSATGRLVAGIEPSGATTKLTVRNVRTGAVVFSVASPSGVALDEPAFSPDGQTIVAGGVDPTDASVSKGLYTIPVWGTRTARLVPGSAGLGTPDWFDTPGATTSTYVVAADLAGGGLVRVTASTGARLALAGTTGALDPSGLPDGSVLYAVNGPSAASISLRDPAGGITVVESYAESEVRWPVLASNGDVYHFLRYPDPGAPTTSLAQVNVIEPDGDVKQTYIGDTYDGSSPGFLGFDARSPFSPGSSDVGGSANHDIIARSSTGVLYGYPVSGVEGRYFDTRQQIGTGWNSMKQIVAIGDLNGDRNGDVMTVDTSGTLWFYAGRGDFRLATRVKAGSGWSSYAIFSTGDFDGDTRADLIARDSSGRLWLYPGNGSGGLLPRKQIGSGWNIFNAIIGPGDWNYDGKPDLLARDRASGALYLYPGTGVGGFTARTTLGSGWNARTGFAAVEMWGGINALFAKTTTGQLLDYDSVGDGVMNGNHVYVAGNSGWTPYTITG